ncbi:MOSC domain-containing protein [Thioalkalivibrio sulfidiphilus]|uniref:MOSC domain-containing protein n=1 Tax=Thioalkalivibrio sulfidiphilus TaxID=1033854 RepID=UPI003B391D62
MIKVGRIGEIWRYPVKGMAGERLEDCALGERGLEGDRIWALRDEAREEVQSCKTRPDLLRCSARCRPGGGGEVEVRFPDGSVLGSDSAEIDERLSALVGRASTLQALRPASDSAFYRRYKPDAHSWLEELAATFEREPGEPLPALDQLPEPLVDHVSVPGSFFVVTTLHLLTTASLRHLKGLHPGADWDRRRFRPNVLIETEPGLEGLVEQDWIGRRLRIGNVSLECVGTTPRCGAITRAQADFDADTAILRTVVREADQNVGVYGEARLAGRVRVGDEVLLD